jgi:hypothetical protein
MVRRRDALKRRAENSIEEPGQKDSFQMAADQENSYYSTSYYSTSYYSTSYYSTSYYSTSYYSTAT